MADTSIQFADKVWNPTTGCTMGCGYCYARRIANRHLPQGGFTDREFTEVRFHADRLVNPLKWKKPQTIFVDSMGDLFDPQVQWEWFYQIVQVMMNSSQHTFLVFTKFAAQMEQFVNSRDIERLVSGRKTNHIIWCATAENQFAADARLGHVCALKWGRKGVSIEPMLGPVDVSKYLGIQHEDFIGMENTDQRIADEMNQLGGLPMHDPWVRGLDWVVCGGQTGSGSRRCDVEWIRSIVQQCKAANVACFVKQLGAHHPSPGDHKGSDSIWWPEDIRVQQFPEVAR